MIVSIHLNCGLFIHTWCISIYFTAVLLIIEWCQTKPKIVNNGVGDEEIIGTFFSMNNATNQHNVTRSHGTTCTSANGIQLQAV